MHIVVWNPPKNIYHAVAHFKRPFMRAVAWYKSY